MDIYKPWLHIIGTLYAEQSCLIKMEAFKAFISDCLKELKVCELGSFYHSFDGRWYTWVVVLQESHISLHTRPECGLLTLDVFLCNYSTNNEKKAVSIFDSIQNYFGGTIKEKIILRR